MILRAVWAGLLCTLGLLGMRFAAAEDWIAASSEELHLTGVPEAPGAPAVYLYRQVDRDDSRYSESIYVRIKILADAGLNYANVEIPFVQGAEHIGSIRARTVRPDGSVVNFDGTTYEKPIVKSERVKYMAKTFTLPEAQVGSILEYRYEHTLPYGWVYDSHWILSQDLFTRSARFSLVPNPSFTVIWSWPLGLPPGTDSPKMEHGKIHLEAHNIPGVVKEEHMPPEDEVRFRVDFIYDPARLNRNDPVEFWKVHGKSLYKKVQEFCDKRSAMEKAAAQVISAGDSPETKLRKLYARVQRIHNLSYSSVAEREARQEKPESIHNVEDVWSKGYGTAEQITWLYLALARAAGIDARPVIISTRDRYFFDHRLMNQTELNSEIVLVKLDGKDLYIEPAVPFNPFGMLPWYETTVEGLCLDKAGGVWLRTPDSVATDSRIERRAAFKLDSGALNGKVTVTYTGLEASWRRLDERSEDAVAREKFLEEDLEGYIPTGVRIKLTNSPDWDAWDTPLVAEYDVEIPGWAAPAGHRALLPMGIFGAAEKHTFEHATRIHPLSFEYCYQHVDDVTIDVPQPWSFESIPGPTLVDFKGMVFKETAQTQQHSLHLTRELILNVSLVGVNAYDAVRQFYQTVRTADEAQAVLSLGRTSRN
ncbi:MAG TPA: DUF3857 and transglutaminase domain-containing protein [Steroidobacteraceae bacterium]